jgi:hypothetical protein
LKVAGLRKLKRIVGQVDWDEIPLSVNQPVRLTYVLRLSGIPGAALIGRSLDSKVQAALRTLA